MTTIFLKFFQGVLKEQHKATKNVKKHKKCMKIKNQICTERVQVKIRLQMGCFMDTYCS